MTLTTNVGWLANMDDDDGARPTADYVMRYAARAFGVSVSALTSPGRTHPLVHFRQVAMAAMVELTGESTPIVGRRFGKDHTTVMNSIARCRDVERLGRALDRLVTACRRQWAIDNGLPDPAQQTLGLEG